MTIRTRVTQRLKFFVAKRRRRDVIARISTSDDLPQGLRVHLGCGPVNIAGWVNLDAQKYSHVHLVNEGFDLGTFAHESVSVVYASHCLEHLTRDDALELLKECYRILGPRGLLILSVPSFDRLCEIYLKSADIGLVERAVLGGQDSRYNYHLQLFSDKSLRNLLREAGFPAVEEWSTRQIFGTDLGDWSSYKFRVGGEDIPVSLNLMAVRL